MVELTCHYCGSKEFIPDDNGHDLQCKKCGKYVDSFILPYYYEMKRNEYDYEKQIGQLEKVLSDYHAKLIMTVYSGRNDAYLSKNLLGKSDVCTINYCRTQIFKGDNSVFFAAHLLDHKYHNVHVTSLCFSNRLPTWRLGGGSSTFAVPVKGPDQLVFTGASVGGVITGGTHIQEGRTTYEHVTIPGDLSWKMTCNLNGYYYETSQITILLNTESVPNRYSKYITTWHNWESITVNSGKIFTTKKLEDVGAPPSISVFYGGFNRVPLDRIVQDYLDDSFHLDDEEYYQKALKLAAQNKREDLESAASMLSLIPEHKDSAFQIETFKHKAETAESKSGCYVATAIYGSYDCPQVWTLRRYRDYTLAETWHGRAFIYTYYAISPTLVKWFGETQWFKNMWKPKLDKMVKSLNEKGVADTPYQDRIW